MASPPELPPLTEGLALQITVLARKRKLLELKRRGTGMKWCLEEGIGGARMEIGVSTSALPPHDLDPVVDRLRRFLEAACAACEIEQCRLHDVKDEEAEGV